MIEDIDNFIKIVGNDILIKIKVFPNSSTNKIIKTKHNTLKIKVTSPPVEGKANKKCIAYLSKQFNIPKTKIKILYGENTRNKIIKICDLSLDDFLEKLNKIS